MPRQSTEDRLADIHAEAIADFDRIQGAVYDERQQCLGDRRFYSVSGAQWEGPHGEQFANKPRYEFNAVHLAVIRIINEYRANRITVDFQSKDGSNDDTMADTCDGLYRADEQACTALEAYDNAFEEAVGGGFGAWRLRACYEDDESEDNERQRVRMEPIHDADSCVFFDLDAKRQDKADAKRCYVLIPYTYEAYEEEFGEHPQTWPKTINQVEFDWCTADVVWVAEYYRVVEKTETVRWFTGLVEGAEVKVTEAEIEADPELLGELAATGFKLARTKKVKRKRVEKYILSGGGILEDCGVIAGRCIPIIPVFGKRWVVDGVERCMGHVRLAKDAQRLYNMLLSWLAEMAGRFDIEKPIVTPEQIAGHAQMWARDNVEKYPYLLLNPVTDENGQRQPSGPLAYTKAPIIPPAMAALTQIAQQALTDLLGNQQAGEEMKQNLSGKAVELIQNRLDMQVFIYMSNFAKAHARAGQVWLSMMRDIATEQRRRAKIVDNNGRPGSVVLNEPAYDKKTGRTVMRNDITRADFDVVSDVGPSSSSLRSAVVRALTGIATITDDPETKQALTLSTVANLEGEGLSDLRDWARAKAVRMGIIKPNEDEKARMAEEQANAKPDAQTEYLMKAAQEAEAKAVKARADTLETLASADLKKAQTAKVVSETEGEQQAQILGVADALMKASQPTAGLER
jgi:hypothetical protein